MRRMIILRTLMGILMLSCAARAQTVQDPQWDFSFQVPDGWTHQHDASGALLGHSTIPGMIMVIPHTAGTLAEMKSLMSEGLQEGELTLTLSGKLTGAGSKGLSGTYRGTYQGQEIRAKGYGVVSQHGGGAFVIAICTPDGYGESLDGAASALLRSIRFDKPKVSSAGSHLVGTWVTMTKSTETTVTLGGNGQFYTNYVASYSGTESGDWGLAREDNSDGRWTSRGSREEGSITLRYKNGREETIQYRVHVENGKVYSNEYWFNGNLYGRKSSE